MKKLFTLLLALVATTALWAYNFEVNGIHYNILTDKTNEVEVMYGYYSGSVTIPASVTYNGTTYSVTSIGYQAFAYCSGLTSVTIPNSVTSIGGYAFYHCEGLTSITIPNSVTSIGSGAFTGCSSLTSITIPNSITSIGSSAFSYCSSLTSITIPENLTSIELGAFSYCSSLTSITIPNRVTGIGYQAFRGCSALNSVTIGNSVTSIGEEAFYGCSSLTSITIPDGVTSIGNRAFSYCSSLTSITIPENLTSIELGAFSYCSSLTSVTIPNSVTTIGNYAFQYCSALTSVTIPNSVTSIGSSAFEGCSGLTSVVWNAKKCANFSSDSAPFYEVRSQITSFTFGDSVKNIPAYMCYGMNNLTSVTIPNSVTSIGSSAFEGCSALTSVVWNAKNCADFSETTPSPFYEVRSQITSFTFGDSVKNIPAYMCCRMKNLISITIGNSVTSIGSGAFTGCSSLTSITIPNSVTSIGYEAFENCSGLTFIKSLAEVPPTLGSYAFYNVSTKIPVYVPCGAVSAYQLAGGWKAFTNIQGPLAEYSIVVGVNDSIMGTSKVDYNTYCEGAQISATAKLGYHFVQWSDGITDNPRTLELTQDTILTAEFATILDGQCGDNLYWAYDEDSKKISITGSGNMYNYAKSTQPWLLFQEQITEVTTSNTTTSIGTSAFEGCVRLGKVSLGYAMENIAAKAFAECKRLYDIYVYASYPPFAEESSFANYNVYLYVPCENQRDYILDVVWGEFKFIECIGAESDETGGDDVTVTPGSNDVTITWPTEDEADTYSIVITKDGEVFCTLTFNNNGQLVSIAFAPGRQGNHPAQYAEVTANGYRFTVTGLDESTKYGYNLEVKDSNNQTIQSYEGEFTTESATAVDEIQSTTNNVEKIFLNGQLLIIRDGKTYNAQGAAL